MDEEEHVVMTLFSATRGSITDRALDLLTHGIVRMESERDNGRKPKSCLGRVFK
jgi:hypothetical protein